MKQYKKLLAIFAAAIMLAICFAGCSGASTSAARDTVYNSSSQYAPMEEYAPAPAATSPVTSNEMGFDYAKGESTSVTAGDIYAGRKIIRNYDISLNTDKFDENMDYIKAKVSELGGYVLSSNLYGSKPEAYGDAGRNIELTIRIPAEKAGEFVNGVEMLGQINYVRDYTDDITDEYYDTDTRLAVLQEQLERLRAIMVETDNLADVIALEDRISQVMLEIESLTGTLKRYDALIDYTTVSLYINERNAITGPAATKTTADRISEGFTDTLNGVGVFFVNFFVWFVSSLPVIVIAAIVVVIIVIIVRAATKKRSKKKAEVKEESKP